MSPSGAQLRGAAATTPPQSVTVREESEAGTSSQCPRCGEDEHVGRNGDVFQYGSCGFEGHSDVVGSGKFLQNVVGDDVELAGSMVRPAVSRENTTERGHANVPRLEWDNHRWRRRDRPTEEEPADQSTREGNLASGVSGTA